MKNWNLRLDHAAIATREPAKLAHVLKLLGLADKGSEDVPSQGVKTYFWKIPPSNPQIEILEVTDPVGVVAKFLDKKGPGIHHLSFEVDHLEDLMAMLKSNGVRLVYDQPRDGAHHMRVNFIHPESTGGILIEVSEKKASR